MSAIIYPVLLVGSFDVIVGAPELILVFLLSSQPINFSNLFWHVSEDFHPPDPAIEANVKDDRAAVDFEEYREPIKPPALIFEKLLQFLNLLRDQFVTRIINVLHGIKVRRLFF
jgi:hypothetical protein